MRYISRSKRCLLVSKAVYMGMKRKISNEKFVVEGAEPLEPLLNISVGEIVYRSLSSHTKEHPALINGHTGESITYSAILEKTCSLAEALRNAGYGPNTTVTISSKNNFQFMISLIASLYIGAAVVPLNHMYTSSELQHTLRISKPQMIFCSKYLVQKYSKLKEELPFIEKLIVIDSEKSTTKAECLTDFVKRNITSTVSKISTTPVDVKNHTAYILCSSGTTGLPKGVMVTHRNASIVYNQFRDHRLHLQNPITLCVLPFFHTYGLNVALAGIMTNSLTVFLNEFDPDTYLKAIQDYKASKIFLAPPMVVSLVHCPTASQYDLSSVKEVFCGAAPLKKTAEEAFKNRLNVRAIRQGYGMTETTFAVVYNEKEENNLKPGSAGKVVPFARLAIQNSETGEFLGPNESGEICIKGEMVMKGYCGNTDATKSTFSEKGWLLTGDVGYYDEDRYFFITDRIKELIKYKGWQVAPAEIEGVLLTHPEILDCGVVGLPNERAGEVPVAFVVRSANSKLTDKDVEDFVKSKLSPQKWIRGGVTFVDKIPKNPSGKILRRELRLLLKKTESNY